MSPSPRTLAWRPIVPSRAASTTFYLVIAVGGALGGLLNGVVAPLLFDRVLEYPLLIVMVPLLLVGLDVDPKAAEQTRPRRRVGLLGVAVGSWSRRP